MGHNLTQAKVPHRQKIALILFGLCLTVVLLELGLRIGGFILLSVQEYRNKQSLKQKGAYRIMCIGESTTQGAYPAVMEKILNQRSVDIRFSSIDKGLSSTNTSLILAQLEENINRYNPNMVIAMMGINDGAIHIPQEVATDSKAMIFLRSLKSDKLFRLIWLHILDKTKETRSHQKDEMEKLSSQIVYHAIDVNKDHDNQNHSVKRLEYKLENEMQPKKKNNKDVAVDDNAYLELGKEYAAQGKIDLAKEAYRNAINANLLNVDAYAQLAWLSGEKDSADIFHKIFVLLTEAIQIDSRNEIIKNNYYRLGVIFECSHRFDEAEMIFKKIIEVDPAYCDAYVGLGKCYAGQKKYILSEAMYRKALSLNSSAGKAWDALAILFYDTGRCRLAEECLEIANEFNPRHYSARTINNFQEVKKILDKHNICFVCVQYPMRSVLPLKKIFQIQEGIIFVDNEQIFKKAVKKSGYKEYFIDMFAGDFGHCTEKGNRLLAENIANVILKEAFGKY
jgi:tetratricopeptide (TPR) repeat protein